MKTGALFAFAARAGAILGEAGDREEQALSAFGFDLGLVFQTVDDLLDEEGDEEVVGKRLRKDAGAGKPTLVSMLGRAGARAEAGSAPRIRAPASRCVRIQGGRPAVHRRLHPGSKPVGGRESSWRITANPSAAGISTLSAARIPGPAARWTMRSAAPRKCRLDIAVIHRVGIVLLHAVDPALREEKFGVNLSARATPPAGPPPSHRGDACSRRAGKL